MKGRAKIIDMAVISDRSCNASDITPIRIPPTIPPTSKVIAILLALWLDMFCLSWMYVGSQYRKE